MKNTTKDAVKSETMKKYGNLCNYVIIAIFLAFLYLPILVFPFVKSVLPEDNSENRKLSTFPKVKNIHDLLKFPAEFDRFWSDNLPFRGVIQQAYADMSFLFFRVSPSSRVIVGKDDGDWKHTWLFYDEPKDGDPIGNIKKTRSITKLAMQRYLRRINENIDKIKTQYNADLFYVVAPNKSTISREYLPNCLGVTADETLASVLYQYFHDHGVKNYIYLEDAMEDEKQRSQSLGIDYPLYYILDTHWNQYGSFIGARATLGLIEPQFTGYNDYRVFSEGYTIKTGDLKK